MRPWSDPLFYAALAAGPAAALVLAVWLPALAWLPGLHYPAQVLLLAILVYPLLEEWLFRGLLQPWIAGCFHHALGPLSAANALTSAAFAALHLLYHPPLWAAAVFLPSLVFGYFRERNGGVAAPVVLHGGYNAAYYLLLAPI
ncbi:MAG: JDVT-CTERM system glutamic-type intramembrane protease [Salinisphaera sp.]|nr:JDVT-CTERM system glutamic-type intramembrane protease [Salinisphaera sp.]